MATVTEIQHTEMETENAKLGELSGVLRRLDKLEGGLLERFNSLLKLIMEKLDDLTRGMQKYLILLKKHILWPLNIVTE